MREKYWEKREKNIESYFGSFLYFLTPFRIFKIFFYRKALGFRFTVKIASIKS